MRRRDRLPRVSRRRHRRGGRGDRRGDRGAAARRARRRRAAGRHAARVGARRAARRRVAPVCSAGRGASRAASAAAPAPERARWRSHDAELFRSGPTRSSSRSRPAPTSQVDHARRRPRGHHARAAPRRRASTGLEPDTEYALDGRRAPSRSRVLPAAVRDARAPAGRLLATFATANDVHFGETECGATR